MPFVYLIVGLVVGFALGLAVMRLRAGGREAETARLTTQVEERDSRIRELQAALEAREAELRKATEQRAGLEATVASINEARSKLEETFKSLAAETLKSSSESFLGLARTQMQSLLAQENGNFEKRREEIEKIVRPLGQSLERYDTQIKELEKSRVDAYAALKQQTLGLAEAQEKLRKETSNLVHALRYPQTRGRWGELTLRRVAELAGMVAHCDFSEQVSVTNSEGRAQRPDMVVHLPAGREIIVDSKVSLDAYLDAMDTLDEEIRKQKFIQHAAQVRSHMDKLASKEYVRQFEKAPDFTILFLPGEPFLSVAAQNDPMLIEDGMRRGIIIATPSTLIALMLAVAKGWREASIEENARKISAEGAELYSRFATLFEHLAGVGSALHRAITAYNQAVGSINSRALPSLRRFKELGATAAPEIPPLETIEDAPRPLDRPDAPPPCDPT
jgi:DNA recombination protein RmuC